MRARPAPPSVRRWRFAFRRSTALAVAATIFLAPACSDDDSSAASEADDSTTTSRPTTITEAEDELAPDEQLRRDIQELLTAYDEVIARIVADPEIASNRDHPAYNDLRALMAPDAEIDPVINALVAAGTRGERQLPHRGGQLPIERRIEGDVEAISDSEYRVLTCARLSYEIFDSADEQISLVDGPIQPADVTVIRTDDELRIKQFEPVEEDACPEDS